MMRISRIAALVIVSIGAVGIARAVTPLPDKYAPRGPVSAPEIDPAGAGAAFTLLSGTLVLIGGRRKKKP